MKRLTALILMLCFASLTFAADFSGAAPTSTTVVISQSVRIYNLNFSNATAGSVTCTFLDLSTDCAGAGCSLWPTVSIAANTKYVSNLGGEPVNGGFSMSCTAAIKVWVQYFKN